MGKSIYESVCSTLDRMDLKYNRHDDDLVIHLGYRGDDLNHDLLIIVNPKQEVIQFVERLPITVDTEKAIDIALAVCLVNDSILIGEFTYGLGKDLEYKINHAYTGSLVGEDTIERMIRTIAFTVEEYDDKFLALNKGYIQFSDFVKKEEE